MSQVHTNGRQNASFTTFTVAALCGAAVGATVALLYAPRSGADFRKQIASRRDRLRRDTVDRAERMKQRAQDAYGQATDRVTDLVDRGRRAVEIGKQEYQKTKAEMAETLQKPSA
jgi:gas vesicle protein